MVHMRLQGMMAELLVKLDPKLYRKYVRSENRKPVLYVELLKALYGTLRAALLFWKRLSKQLVDWGFEINPYDWCVTNKMVNGRQLTVLWHVDDLKISHMDDAMVTNLVDQLELEFGKEAPLTITRGKVHDYLGMTLDFSLPGKVQVSMFDYIDKMLEALPTNMDSTAATPAAQHLFKVNNNPEALDEDTAQMFHHNTAKLTVPVQAGST